ncbi:acetylserotonin O-methyltransferase [Myxococcus stipitatus]|uniref:methyltransferase n=1 Tax=Myxococcus stipitatus TaxID=83455 RepID=UPI003145187E
MSQMVYGFWVSRALHVMAELGIADIIGDVPKTVEELAKATGAHAPALRRLLRLLSGVGVLVKDEQTQGFGLTELGMMVRKDSPGSVYWLLMSQGHHLSWKAWGELKFSVQSGQPTLEKIMGDSFFGYLSKHPEEGALFNESMAAYQNLNAPAVVAAYDFSKARSVMDLGGGTGTLLAHILQAHPGMKGALFELPHVHDGAVARMAELGLGSRTKVVAGDFFETIPSGHDLYILSQILHDWDDERCVQLLTNVRAAMGPDSKLLIVETVLPGDNQPHFGNLYDVAMMVLVGGRERTGPEYTALVEKAGLRVNRVSPTTMPPSVVEVVPA